MPRTEGSHPCDWCREMFPIDKLIRIKSPRVKTKLCCQGCKAKLFGTAAKRQDGSPPEMSTEGGSR